MNPHERDELLTRIDERVLRLVHVVEGNGQPGLVEKVANLEGRNSTPKNVSQGAGGGAAAGLFIIVAGAWLKQKLGIQ